MKRTNKATVVTSNHEEKCLINFLSIWKTPIYHEIYAKFKCVKGFMKNKIFLKHKQPYNWKVLKKEKQHIFVFCSNPSSAAAPLRTFDIYFSMAT